MPTAWAASVRGMAWHTGGSGDLHAERVLGERALGERVKTGGPVLEAPPEPRSTSPPHPSSGAALSAAGAAASPPVVDTPAWRAVFSKIGPKKKPALHSECRFL